MKRPPKAPAAANRGTDFARELCNETGQALYSPRCGLRLLEREVDAGDNVSAQAVPLMQRTETVTASPQWLTRGPNNRHAGGVACRSAS